MYYSFLTREFLVWAIVITSGIRAYGDNSGLMSWWVAIWLWGEC